MRNKITILSSFLPNYGEILMAVGSIAIENKETLLENMVAREELKQYLLSEVAKVKCASNLSRSSKFQMIIYEYTGKFISIKVLKDECSDENTTDIYLFDFFTKVIWPIIVKKYMDNLYKTSSGTITVSTNVKKNVYITIYEEDNPNLFFNEFKKLLLYNNIIISEATVKENGDILLKLMIPIAPHTRFNY